MLIKKVTLTDLTKVSNTVPVIFPYEPYSSGGGLRVRWVPRRDEDYRKEHGHYRYQRRSAGWQNTERKIWALCWHGYREVFRALFKIAPEARIYTALARRAGIKYYSAGNFERVFPETGLINIGSAYMPVPAHRACFCSETADDCDSSHVPHYASIKLVSHGDLTAECWLVQFNGLQACHDCEALNTPDCGGQAIRKSLKNEKGLEVPLS